MVSVFASSYKVGSARYLSLKTVLTNRARRVSIKNDITWLNLDAMTWNVPSTFTMFSRVWICWPVSSNSIWIPRVCGESWSNHNVGHESWNNPTQQLFTFTWDETQQYMRHNTTHAVVLMYPGTILTLLCQIKMTKRVSHLSWTDGKEPMTSWQVAAFRVQE